MRKLNEIKEKATEFKVAYDQISVEFLKFLQANHITQYADHFGKPRQIHIVTLMRTDFTNEAVCKDNSCVFIDMIPAKMADLPLLDFCIMKAAGRFCSALNLPEAKEEQAVIVSKNSALFHLGAVVIGSDIYAVSEVIFSHTLVADLHLKQGFYLTPIPQALCEKHLLVEMIKDTLYSLDIPMPTTPPVLATEGAKSDV